MQQALSMKSNHPQNRLKFLNHILETLTVIDRQDVHLICRWRTIDSELAVDHLRLHVVRVMALHLDEIRFLELQKFIKGGGRFI